MGLGVDILDISRFETALSRYGDRFIQRLFTKDEQAYAEKSPAKRLERYAVRFAAKEAVFKALPDQKGVFWQDIETLNDSSGRPYIRLSSRVQERYSDLDIQVSLSHSQSQAIAICQIS